MKSNTLLVSLIRWVIVCFALIILPTKIRATGPAGPCGVSIVADGPASPGMPGCFTISCSTNCISYPGCTSTNPITVALVVSGGTATYNIYPSTGCLCPPDLKDCTITGVTAPPTCGGEFEITVTPGGSTNFCILANNTTSCGAMSTLTVSIAAVCETNGCLSFAESGTNSATIDVYSGTDPVVYPEGGTYVIAAGTTFPFDVTRTCVVDGGYGPAGLFNLAMTSTAFLDQDYAFAPYSATSTVQAVGGYGLSGCLAATCTFGDGELYTPGILLTSPYLANGATSANVIMQPGGQDGPCGINPCCETISQLEVIIVDTNRVQVSLAAVTSNENTIVVSWQGDPSASVYSLFRSTASGGPYTAVDVTTNSSYIDTGLDADTTYYYYVVVEYDSYGGVLSPVIIDSIVVNATTGLFQPPAFVAIANGDNDAAFSYDGITWQGSPGGLPFSDSWESVTYGNGKYVAIAQSTNAAYSTNGITWWPAVLPVSDSWQSVTYGSGKFVAVAQSANSAYSSDGINWTLSPGGLPRSDTWQSVVYGINSYGLGLFVTIVGDNDGLAAYSSDGSTWTESPGGGLPDENCWTLAYAGFGGNYFIATTTSGDNDICTSADGTNWSLMSYTLPYYQDWQCAAAGNGTLATIANDSDEASWFSAGVGWESTSMPSSAGWNSVAFGSSIFVAVAGGSNNAAYSSDGGTWVASTLPSPDNWISVAAKQ